MIITVTFNPAIDYNITLNDFTTNSINKFDNYNYMVGGKGINNSVLLNNIGIKSTATGFIGGFSGEKLMHDISRYDNIYLDFIETDGDTRINVKLATKDSETEINGKGQFINSDMFCKLIDKIRNYDQIEYLLISGSVPNSYPNAYEETLDALSDLDIKIAIDTTKDQLLKSLKYSPFLIKPNILELEEIFNTKISSKDGIVVCARKLIEQGAQNVVVSLGKDGALFVNKDLVYCAKAPIGKVINTVGSGDSLVAGFIAKYLETGNYKDSFRFSIACGSATAFSEQIAKSELIHMLYNNIQVNELT